MTRVVSSLVTDDDLRLLRQMIDDLTAAYINAGAGVEDIEEVMEILGGALNTLLPGATEWVTFAEGQTFEVPANSRFSVSTSGVCDYCCSYVKE